PYVAKVETVLDYRRGIPVALEDDGLGLIVVEVDLVLQRAGVLGPRDLDGLSGQALELLEVALVKLEPTYTLNLTHVSRTPLWSCSQSVTQRLAVASARVRLSCSAVPPAQPRPPRAAHAPIAIGGILAHSRLSSSTGMVRIPAVRRG